MNWIAVAIGGAMGSVLRYAVALLGMRMFGTAFPSGTFTVNILGSFLIGVVWAAPFATGWNTETRALVFTGLLGGFTTFSTFALDAQQLFRAGDSKAGFFYIAGSVILGLAAAYAGIMAGQRINP